MSIQNDSLFWMLMHDHQERYTLLWHPHSANVRHQKIVVLSIKLQKNKDGIFKLRYNFSELKTVVEHRIKIMRWPQGLSTIVPGDGRTIVDVVGSQLAVDDFLSLYDASTVPINQNPVLELDKYAELVGHPLWYVDKANTWALACRHVKIMLKKNNLSRKFKAFEYDQFMRMFVVQYDELGNAVVLYLIVKIGQPFA